MSKVDPTTESQYYHDDDRAQNRDQRDYLQSYADRQENASALIMTRPEEIADHRFTTVTGNDFVSLPEIDAWGRILNVTFLHARCAGLIELRGISQRRMDGNSQEASKKRESGGDGESGDDAPGGFSSWGGRVGNTLLTTGVADGEPGVAPFMAPTLVWNGKAVDLMGVLPEVALNGDWIPEFSWAGGQCRSGRTEGGASADGGPKCEPKWRLSARIVAPPEEKGFCYILQIENLGCGNAGPTGDASLAETAGPARAEIGVELVWAYSGIRVFTSRELPVVHTCRYDPWTRSVVAEALGPLPVFGFALNSSDELDRLEVEGRSGGTPTGESRGVCAAAGVTNPPCAVRASKSVTLAPGEHATLAFYVAFNREADGARTTSVHLRRLGWQALEAATCKWLAERRRRVPGMPREESVLNRNLLFNYFFATGKTMDSEQLVAVTSRSPRYYVSAAFWSRDVLLWSLPALVIMDRTRAREVLLYALSVGTRHAGDHAQYIDGRALYPGFELDEAAAYFVGLGTYIEGTSDFEVLKEPGVLEAIRRTLAAVEEWLFRTDSGEPVLCRTFLDPSDDPVILPFLTYNNVLLRKGLLAAAAAFDHLGGEHRELARKVRQDAEFLGEAIRRYCIVDGPFGPMYAWAVELEPCGGSDGGEATGSGRFEVRRTGAEIYDDPPGSLELLGFYGYCRDDKDAVVLANTRRWIHSRHNRYFSDGGFGGPGSAHSPHPWPMAAANVILAEVSAFEATGSCDLAAVKDAVRLLVTAPMDGGLACESMDRDTGKVKTGAAFATGAGFLAHSLWRGLDLLTRKIRTGILPEGM